jgi:hypothetical protein
MAQALSISCAYKCSVGTAVYCWALAVNNTVYGYHVRLSGVLQGDATG